MLLLMQTADHENNNCSSFISVIVAIKNEEDYIEKCLDSLVNQTISKDVYRIMIVDGGSTDNTINLITPYIKKYPDFITLFHNPKQWQSCGRNIAIAHDDKSNLIAYIDGHCIADAYWLENLYHSYMESKSDSLAGIGSIHCSPDDETKIGKAIDQVFLTPLGGMGTSYQPQKEKKSVMTAPFVLYSKKAVQQVGGYDEDMKIGEDFTLNYKLREKKFSLFIEPKAIVYYYKKQSFIAFFKQMLNYGYAKAIIAKKYPSSISIFQYIPSLFLLGLFVNVLLVLFLPIVIFFIGAVVLCYLILILSFTLLTTLRKQEVFYCYFMPIIFLLQHIGFSIGFLIGLFKKGWAQ